MWPVPIKSSRKKQISITRSIGNTHGYECRYYMYIDKYDYMYDDVTDWPRTPTLASTYAKMYTRVYMYFEEYVNDLPN
jgi:hypothetical protein